MSHLIMNGLNLCALFAVLCVAVQAASVHPGMYYNRPLQKPVAASPESISTKNAEIVPSAPKYNPMSSWFFPGSRRFAPVSDSINEDAVDGSDVDMRSGGTWKRMGHPGRYFGRMGSAAKAEIGNDSDNIVNDADMQNVLGSPMSRYNFFRLMGN